MVELTDQMTAERIVLIFGLSVDLGSINTLCYCLFPIDGPPLDLQGAPVVGPSLGFYTYYPELTGLGVELQPRYCSWTLY